MSIAARSTLSSSVPTTNDALAAPRDKRGMRLFFGAVCVLVMACGQPPKSQPEQPGETPLVEPDAGVVEMTPVDAGPATRTVTVTEVNEYFDEHGTSTRVESVGAAPVLRTFTSLGGSVTHAPVRVGNTIEFRSLPAGPYRLETPTLMVESSESTIDLGERKFGRADLVRSTTTDVEVIMTVTDGGSALLPTQKSDSMTVYAPGAGLVQEWLLYPHWPLGTMFEQTSFSYWDSIGMSSPGLVDADKGDSFFVLFQRPTDLTSDTYCNGVTSVAEAHPKMSLGTNNVDLNFTAATSFPSSMFSLKWRRSEWSRLSATVHPSPAFAFMHASLRVAPGGGSADDDSLEIASCSSVEATDLDLSTPYPTFFPSIWKRSISTELTVVGPNKNGEEPVGTIWAKGEAPRVLPPTELKIAGVEASALQIFNSGKPMDVSWSPSTRGPAPQLYRVTLLSQGEAAYQVLTAAQAVSIPSERLIKGRIYYVVVTAIETTVPVTSPVRAVRERQSSADAMSDLFEVR